MRLEAFFKSYARIIIFRCNTGKYVSGKFEKGVNFGQPSSKGRIYRITAERGGERAV